MLNGPPNSLGKGVSVVRARVLGAWLAAGVLVATVLGAEPALRRLERAGEFWVVPEAEKTLRWEVDMELTVLYFDPHWNLLWGVADLPLYLPLVAGHAPDLRSGQRVRLRGSVVPAQGFAREEIQVTVLDEEAWPAPRRVAGEGITDAALNAHWVELEGVVANQTETDATHVEYRLVVDGRLVVMRLQVDAGDPLPQLLDRRVRVRGVHMTTHEPSGRFVQADLWVARARDIEVTGSLADDARFQLPVTTIDKLGEAPVHEWVRVAGTVQSLASGNLTVRDDTGQITVATAQTGASPGTRIQIVGRPQRREGMSTLEAPLWRRDGPVTSAPAPLQKLRLAAQVLELESADAAKAHPVALRGVVTWSHPSADFFYLEDASGGVRVTGRFAGSPPPVPGSPIRLEGTTASGPYAPEVQLTFVGHETRLALPPPRTVSPEQIMTGQEEARRVALLGFVRGVKPEAGWQRLELVTATGEFVALAPAEVDVGDLDGAIVRVVGTCAARADEHGRLTGFVLWVPDRGALEIAEPKPADPFSRERQSILSLRRFSSRRSAVPAARVAGRVTGVREGSFFMQEGTAGLQVLLRAGPAPAVGSAVEVVGLIGREGQRTVMREAQWRALETHLPHPLTLPLADADVLRPEAETAVVRITGRLVEVHRREGESRLRLQSGERSFEATIPAAAPWLPGSWLTLTGVYMLEYNESGRPRGFALRLRSPKDVVVVSAPSWWTAGRLSAILAAVGIVGLAALAWVGVLRRQVARQTAQIRSQWEREARMQSELERSTRLESLGVLAGGIAHDFNNLLTAILGNLGLIALDPNAMNTCGRHVENARRATRRAGDITQQLLTFARGGDPIRTAVPLGELAREAAGFALHGSKVRAEFDLAADARPAAIDAAQLTRVIHNLVLNAVQAMPGGGTVRLTLREVTVRAGEFPTLVPGPYLCLSVADTGPGIPEAELPRLFEPYFSTKQGNTGLGLAVVRSIIQKHEGHVAVESVRGRGTVFSLWLPVAQSAPEPAPEVAAPALSVPRRVLLMDDEAIIRDTATMALAASGHDATAVPDGAAAVQAYAAARAAGKPFEVVILDLTVPGGMGGEQAVQEILKLDPAARVIVSSGYSSNPVMARYRDYGFCAVVPKPYEVSGLLRAVEFAAAAPT